MTTGVLAIGAAVAIGLTVVRDPSPGHVVTVGN
jgi:hypothetical protein